MCNLYSQTSSQQAVRDLVGAFDRLGNQPILPAVFPDMEAPVCRHTKDGKDRELVTMRWGFPKVRGPYVTNARNLRSSYWKGWFDDTRFRCLVPANSFAEYHPTEKTPEGHKAATWFCLEGDEPRPPFMFAGLWRPWDGERKKSEVGKFSLFTILTTEANELVAPIHPKAMPVVLDPDDYETWMSAPAAAEAVALQRPYTADQISIAFTGEKEDPGNS